MNLPTYIRIIILKTEYSSGLMSSPPAILGLESNIHIISVSASPNRDVMLTRVWSLSITDRGHDQCLSAAVAPLRHVNTYQ